jgi:hypothetical protein
MATTTTTTTTATAFLDEQQQQQQQSHQQQTPPLHQNKRSDSQRDDSTDNDEWLIQCRCESAKAVESLLACLRQVSTTTKTTKTNNKSLQQGNYFQPVTVYCSPSSLAFHVHGKSTQASVDLHAGFFRDYHVLSNTNVTTNSNDNDVSNNSNSNDNNNIQDWQAGGEFSVNLTTVLDCLHVLSNHAQVSFSYNLTKELFQLELLDPSGVLSSVAIPGVVPPTTTDDDDTSFLAHAFRSSPIAARMIVKSETLKQVTQELELVMGASAWTVLMGKTTGLELAVVGHLGQCVVSIPPAQALSMDVAAATVDSPPTPARSYALSSLLASMRGLDVAQETCITINAKGMMAIQHQVVDAAVGDGNPNFVDFIMCCLQEDDDEDEDEASRVPSQLDNDPSTTTLSQNSSTQAQSRASMTHESSCRGNDSGSETEDGSHPLTSSVAPLFGTVHTTASTRRMTLQRRRRMKLGRQRRKRDDDDTTDGETSVALLDQPDDQSSSSENDDEETQALDVTAVSSPIRHSTNSDDECSSPEVVYGRQY